MKGENDMIKELQAIDTLRQTAVMTVRVYGEDDPIGHELVNMLHTAVSRIAYHSERDKDKREEGAVWDGAAYLSSFDEAVVKAAEHDPEPIPKKSEDDTRLVRKVLLDACKKSKKPQEILDMVDAADYVMDFWRTANAR
jgi:hypothetical protein